MAKDLKTARCIGIVSQLFNAAACFALGVFMLYLHDISTWKVMMMFSAVDSFFWAFVYFMFAACGGDFSLSIGTILGMCVGPVGVILGALLNWLVGPEGTMQGQYGISLMIFGVLVFIVNVWASLEFRNTSLCGTGMDKIMDKGPLLADANKKDGP